MDHKEVGPKTAEISWGLRDFKAVSAVSPPSVFVRFVMPVPSFNVINGGSHAGNRLACQAGECSKILVGVVYVSALILCQLSR